jgi:6-phosphofructo-2-kinase/fructose-2,6-biphosphatase 2
MTLSSARLILKWIRAKIEARVAKEKDLVLIFLESVCDDPAVIAANVALKASSGDPDYKDMSREDAMNDFLGRIRQYEEVYETITEPHLSYLRITNVGSQVTVCRIHGYLQSRIAFYLMNLHIKPRTIFFSRVSCNFLSQTFRLILIPIAWRKHVQFGG